MSPIVAYFIGLLTIIIIFIPFWYLARENDKVKPLYKSIFCDSIASATVTRNLS